MAKEIILLKQLDVYNNCNTNIDTHQQESNNNNNNMKNERKSLIQAIGILAINIKLLSKTLRNTQNTQFIHTKELDLSQKR